MAYGQHRSGDQSQARPRWYRRQPLVMPSPVRTARASVAVAQRLSGDRRKAALAVMAAARAAAAVLEENGAENTAWIKRIYDEAVRIWLHSGPNGGSGDEAAQLAAINEAAANAVYDTGSSSL
jgi:hypothetical protein